MTVSTAGVPLQYKNSTLTVTTLGNAVELTKGILRAIVGNELADSLNGEQITDEQFNVLIATEMRNALFPKTGV